MKISEEDRRIVEEVIRLLPAATQRLLNSDEGSMLIAMSSSSDPKVQTRLLDVLMSVIGRTQVQESVRKAGWGS